MYFLAMVVSAAIHGGDPAEAPFQSGDLPAEVLTIPAPPMAKALQQFAWDSVQGNARDEAEPTGLTGPMTVAFSDQPVADGFASNSLTMVAQTGAAVGDPEDEEAVSLVALHGNALENPSIGMGLSGISDWTTQSPFLDVFKTARDWIGNVPGQWGGIETQQVQAILDADGWPTRLPAGASSITTVILTELPAQMTSAEGRYRLAYDGTGVIEITGATNLRYGTGEIWFDYTPTGEGVVNIRINRTTNGDHIRNITVVHQDHIAEFDQGQIFNPAWLDLVSDMRSLRFMDWMRTNNSQQSDWADRPMTGDYSWGTDAGVPLEIMVELANLTGTDPWFTLPHLASDDYIRNFATYVRDNLDLGLKAHFEYSNEVWNWQFQQAQWADAQGKSEWPDSGAAWVEYYAGQATNMAQIIDRVFGAQADGRVVKVLSTQTGWLGLEETILNAPNWVTDHPGSTAPFGYFDAYAVTGYFDGGLGRDDKPVMVKQWLARSLESAQADADTRGLTSDARAAYIQQHQYDQAGNLAFQELRDGSVSGEAGGSLQDVFAQFAYHKGIADAHGLQMVMYEGGTHIVGVGKWVDDQQLTDFFTWLNQHDGMGDLYAELLTGWRAAGGTMFNAFVDVGVHSKWGSWGNLEHIDDSSARWDALAEFNRDSPGWWEDRATDAFIGTAEQGSNNIAGRPNPEPTPNPEP